jgi:hydroxyethylthiazole kinase-like uncharacterized protein yjeF
MPGRLHCGSLHVADFGIPVSVLEHIRPRIALNDPAGWGINFPWPRHDGHKYDRGHVVVLSGGISSTGAARLAARGALRAGAGLVTIASPREALAVNAAATLAIMVRAIDGAAEFSHLLQDRRVNAAVLGPGGGVGPLMRDQAIAALSGERAVVLDADALTSFAGEAEALGSVIQSRGAGPTVLTPHEGEFARLFKGYRQITEFASKIDKAKAAAAATGAIVLLKGPDTVVAAPDGRASIAANAPPWLATAGSGDVLAGFAAGLLAQGMPGFEAASAAVWLHGAAANGAGPGMISEDLPEMLPKVYREVREQARKQPGTTGTTPEER